MTRAPWQKLLHHGPADHRVQPIGAWRTHVRQPSKGRKVPARTRQDADNQFQLGSVGADRLRVGDLARARNPADRNAPVAAAAPSRASRRAARAYSAKRAERSGNERAHGRPDQRSGVSRSAQDARRAVRDRAADCRQGGLHNRYAGPPQASTVARRHRAAAGRTGPCLPVRRTPRALDRRPGGAGSRRTPFGRPQGRAHRSGLPRPGARSWRATPRL